MADPDCVQPHKPAPTLPAAARLPINRCNLPAHILGGLTFQQHPTPIHIDNVRELHGDLFQRLAGLDSHDQRTAQFTDYMSVRFCLHELEEAGYQKGRKKHRRKADYLRMVRGWSFDADSREGAVIKGWAESRFGLLPRHHGEPIGAPDSDAYRRFQEMRSAGIYNTNALDAQLDLLFAYAQHELAIAYPAQDHLNLYRGINRLGDHEVVGETEGRRRIVILNNVNSFTDNRERAEEFGDYILEARVPLAKIFFYNRLLPGMLRGEDEFVVIGGMYEVAIRTY